MKQHYMVIDVALCHDCNNCFIACKDEYVGNEWPPYTNAQPRHGPRWMNIQRGARPVSENRRVLSSHAIQHCEDAPCVAAHPDCISRREDGIVLIDMEKAKGKKELVESCPFGAIYWNEEANVAQKCTMCAHLLDNGWEIPRCAHSCPTGAISFYTLELSEMDEKIKAEKLERYRPGYNSNAHVYYKNLYRFEKLFIAGGVIKDNDCLENAEVTLAAKEVIASQKTNYFGDFKFDNLEPGDYTIAINGKEMQKVSLEASLNVGSIVL
jgi:Fe-S-cluster-containing dehydrogenase component